MLAAIGRAVREETNRSTGTVARLRRRVEQILVEEYEIDPAQVMPARATFYRLVEQIAAGKHTFGSARTRRSLAQRPDGKEALIGHVRRTVCRRCAARHDAFVFAVTWQPAEIMLCRKHLVWVGPERRSHQSRQYYVGDLPDIVRAQHRHRKLARRVGREIAAEAFADAAHVTALWARRGRYRDRRAPSIQVLGHMTITSRMVPGDPATSVVTYPETVDLAYVLADPRWRFPRRKYGVFDYRGFHDDISDRLGIRYNGNDPHDPVQRWRFKRRDLAWARLRPKRRRCSRT